MDVIKLAKEKGIAVGDMFRSKNQALNYVGVYCKNYKGKAVIGVDSEISFSLKRLIVLYFLTKKDLGRLNGNEMLSIFGEFDKEAMALAYQRLILEHDNDYQKKNYVDANKVALDEMGLPITLGYLKNYLFEK